MTTSAAETCGGDCSDAGYYHNFSDDGVHKCDDVCRRGRFEGRCHCGRKYATEKPPHPRSEDALLLISKLFEARITAARVLGLHEKNVGLSLHNVSRDLWEAIDAPENSISGKRVKLHENDAGVLVFPTVS